MAPGIRALRKDDIPAIVAVRRKAFKRSQRRDDADLAEYIDHIFLSSPFHDPELPSLVYVNTQGSPAGFLGVTARRGTFCDKPIRIAVSSQMMVDPAERGLAGVQLVKTFLSGPQTLSFADLSNGIKQQCVTGCALQT